MPGLYSERGCNECSCMHMTALRNAVGRVFPALTASPNQPRRFSMPLYHTDTYDTDYECAVWHTYANFNVSGAVGEEAK